MERDLFTDHSTISNGFHLRMQLDIKACSCGTTTSISAHLSSDTFANSSGAGAEVV
jgi:hypothetical protein